MTATRLLKPTDVPALLWDSEQGVLTLPDNLVNAYSHIIDRCELRELATTRNCNDPPVGGLTKELTDKHFAQAFDGSAARALLALLDPHNCLSHVSNTFIEALAGNRICLIDVPCGAGATSYAFLTAIADLRAECVLPRVPLDVTLLGADLSMYARAYADELLALIKPDLEKQAIFVSAEFRSWDATNKMSTTALIQKSIELSANDTRRLVIVANFSGFLERESKRTAAEPQLEEIFRYTSGPNCAALWIEPNMNRVTASGGTFAWVVAKVKETWRQFMSVVGVSDGTDSHFTSSARFREPLAPGITPNVRIAVMPIRLEHQE